MEWNGMEWNGWMDGYSSLRGKRVRQQRKVDTYVAFARAGRLQSLCVIWDTMSGASICLA